MHTIQAKLCRTLAGVAMVALAGACASGGSQQMAMSEADMQAHMRAAAVMDAADRAEIAEAQLALSRTSNAEVRRYAQMMVDEHTTAMQNRRTSMQAMGMTMAPASSDATVRMLESSHMQAMQRLSPMSGAAFDRMYMQRQVEAHSSVLQALGSTMPMGTMAMGSGATRSNAPAGGITPASGGYAVPLSCDPGQSPAGPGSGRTESGVGTADNQQPRGNCGTPADRPPLHGSHAEKGSMGMGMDAMHRNAVAMVSAHLQMARDLTARM